MAQINIASLRREMTAVFVAITYQQMSYDVNALERKKYTLARSKGLAASTEKLIE